VEDGVKIVTAKGQVTTEEHKYVFVSKRAEHAMAEQSFQVKSRTWMIFLADDFLVTHK
jgi:hypothetical protein